MGEKMKRFLQEQSNREAEEILSQIEADADMADVHAPDEMEAALFARIDEYEKEKAHRNLSAEDKELIELGKAFKKQKKRRKYAAVASIAIMGMLFSGITAMGGPERVVEKVTWILAGREQTNIDSDSDRIEEPETVSEEEAYERIEEEFGFTPVKMTYLPQGVDCQCYLIDNDTQYINVLFQGKRGEVITYVIRPNYNVGSIGSDVDDILLDEYSMEIEERKISIKHFEVKENNEERWVLEFTENNIYYFIQICDLDKGEVEKIVNNLYFDN